MNNKKIFYFSLGRNAIYAVLRILKISSQDEVLTPAWDCDGTLEPFRAIGCKLIFYKTDPYTFEADLDHIENLITPNTKLLHIINHFGQPQRWDEILEIKEKYNIPVLEDNAYSFLSKLGEKEFGSFGDFSVFSLRKNLPLPDGAILRINNNSKYSFNKSAKWLYPPEYKRTFNIILRSIKLLFRIEKFSLKKTFKKNRYSSKYLPPLYSDEIEQVPIWDRGKLDYDFTYDYERPMSKLSSLIYNIYSPAMQKSMAESKRCYYKFLVNELKNFKGIEIIKSDLEEGVIPFCLSILIKNQRDKILSQLQSNRHPVMAWPTLPLEVLCKMEEFPEIRILGKQLLQINILYGYSFSRYQKLVRELKTFLNKG